MLDLLKQIRQDLGTTIVLVTHNPEIVAKADRHITLKDGVIIDQATAPTKPQPHTPVTIKLPGSAFRAKTADQPTSTLSTTPTVPALRLDDRRQLHRQQAQTQPPNISQEN